MNIKNWVDTSTEQLKKQNGRTPKLDCELILYHVLQKDRTWIHSHNDYNISQEELSELNKLLEKRLGHFPIAYILGKKEFYGRDFKVDENVLIPRPETEDLIDLVIENTKNTDEIIKIIDIGTGSGCIPITLKNEIPNSDVYAVDISEAALDIAKNNAKNLNTKINFIQSNLMHDIKEQDFDIITANLPYVDKNWERSPETDFEPKLALFADNQGLELIYKLIQQAPKHLKKDGLLFLEADECQHDDIIKFANEHKFQLIGKKYYILSFKKIN